MDQQSKSMRLNKYIARASGISRRQADEAIASGRVTVNGSIANIGQPIDDGSVVKLDGKVLKIPSYTYILINKPLGYLCSRKSQDNKPTIYEILPADYGRLKTAGRLDADSRGLILMTDDGDYAHQLMHPSFQKTKHYQIKLNRPINAFDINRINNGVGLEDGVSKLNLTDRGDYLDIKMTEGRNRQIRRTFAALGYEVSDLLRTKFGPYSIEDLGEKVYSTTIKKPIHE